MNMSLGVVQDSCSSILQLQHLTALCPCYSATQMGSMFKESIFDEHIQQGIIGWCTKAKIKAKAKGNTKTEGDSNGGMHMFNTNGTYQMQTAIVHNAETSSDLEAKIVAVDIIPNSVLPSR
eukprot:Gb_02684 [translate_table: standard]